MDTGNLLTVVFGLCFIAAGLYAYSYLGRFAETARESSGVVVEVVYELGSTNGPMPSRSAQPCASSVSDWSWGS